MKFLLRRGRRANPRAGVTVIFLFHII